MKRRVVIPVLLVLLLLIAAVPAAFAAPALDTVIGENEVVNNDVVVLDGNLEIQHGAVVNGDVVVFNGDALVDGRVNGSVTLFNGSLETGDDVIITGECVLLNGELTGSSTLIDCTAIENLNLQWDNFSKLAPNLFPNVIPPVPPIAPELPAAPLAPEAPITPVQPVPATRTAASTGGSIFGILALTVLTGFLGFLAGAIMPANLRQIVSVARRKPLVSGLAGGLTAVAVPSLIVLLIPVSIILTFVCIGLLGFPIMILLALGLMAGLVLGWIAVGAWLGERLFNREGQRSLAWSAALGTALLTFGVGLLDLIPFVIGEQILIAVIFFVGLGAVALTQFGMKPYPRDPEQPIVLDEDKIEDVLKTLPDEAAEATS